MIGQEKFLKSLNNFNISNFPHSILLLGEQGAGHKEVCSIIADRFDFCLVDISDMITTEFINQIYLSSNQTLYIVDINKISDKEQNVLLKLFEEPNAYTYLILYGESTYNVLETIVNRSYIMKLDSYSREQLEPLITSGNKEYILQLCSTPGQIEVANHTNIDELKKLCLNIIGRLKEANFANALTIANKINFSDEYDKYDLSLFIKVLGNVMLNEQQYKLYDCLNAMSRNIWFMNDKKRYFEHFIIKSWKASRGL